MTGAEMHGLACRLYPICRSITGLGVRETLGILQEVLPIKIESVRSGTRVFDWEVPEEWHVREAWVADSQGRRIIDFAGHNLHLLQYSQPFSGRVSRADLEAHLHSLPAQPSLIPYKTSYYRKDWGFCLTEEQKAMLLDSEYSVHIATSFFTGVLNYGEIFVPGRSSEEILISTHICHPSLANDNLSGILVALNAALHFTANPGHYSIRFVFVPGTIGAITWLATNPQKLNSIEHGLVLTGLGAGEGFHYKQSRNGNSAIDRVSELTLRESGQPFQVQPFSPYGYDERQYNSPGIGLPVGCLMRTPHGSYPEYHTSADNMDFLKPDALQESSDMLIQILTNLGDNGIYRNLSPYGEPQLGKRGLYASNPAENMDFLWVLNLSDGKHSLLDIAHRSGSPFSRIKSAAARLSAAGLLDRIT
jgi:aminopeptidase-like protein